MNVLLRASHIPIIVFVFFGLARGAYLVDFSNMLHRNLANVKRDGKYWLLSYLSNAFLLLSKSYFVWSEMSNYGKALTKIMSCGQFDNLSVYELRQTGKAQFACNISYPTNVNKAVSHLVADWLHKRDVQKFTDRLNRMHGAQSSGSVVQIDYWTNRHVHRYANPKKSWPDGVGNLTTPVMTAVSISRFASMFANYFRLCLLLCSRYNTIYAIKNIVAIEIREKLQLNWKQFLNLCNDEA